MYLDQLLEMTPEQRYAKLWDFGPAERMLAKNELEAYIRRSPPHPAWPGLLGAVVGIGLHGVLQGTGYWSVAASGMLLLGVMASLFGFAMSLARQAARERDWPIVAALAEDIVEIQEQMNLPLGGYAGLRPGYLEDLADDLDAHVHAHTVQGMSTLHFTWETLPKPVIAQAQRIFDIAPTNPKIREWAKKYIGAARVDSFRTPGGASIKHDPILEIRGLMKGHTSASLRDELFQAPLDPDGGMPEGEVLALASDGRGNRSLIMKGKKLEFQTVDELVARGNPPGKLIEVPRRPRTPIEQIDGSYLLERAVLSDEEQARAADVAARVKSFATSLGGAVVVDPEAAFADAVAAQVAALDAENGPDRTEAILRGAPLPPMEPVHTGFAPALHSEPPAHHSPSVEHHSSHDYSAPTDHHHDTTGGDFGSGSYE